VNKNTSDNYLAWKTGVMDFENESLKDIIPVLKSTYQIEFELSDREIASCTLTAHFEDADIDEVLKVISSTLNIQYKKEETKVVFSGQGC
jgi:transmembrane sensor